jgi:hypothetical protein
VIEPERAEPCGDATAAIDVVDLALALREAIAEAGIDQRDVAAVDRERAVQAHPNAVPGVRGDLLCPERLRHDAEHRAPVHREEPVVHGMDPDASERDHAATAP